MGVSFRAAMLGPRALLVAVVIGLIFGPILGLICALSYGLMNLTVSAQMGDIHQIEQIWRGLFKSRYIPIRIVFIIRQATRFFQNFSVSHVPLVAAIIGLSFGLSAGLRDILNVGQGLGLRDALNIGLIYEVNELCTKRCTTCRTDVWAELRADKSDTEVHRWQTFI